MISRRVVVGSGVLILLLVVAGAILVSAQYLATRRTGSQVAAANQILWIVVDLDQLSSTAQEANPRAMQQWLIKSAELDRNLSAPAVRGVDPQDVGWLQRQHEAMKELFTALQQNGRSLASRAFLRRELLVHSRHLASAAQAQHQRAQELRIRQIRRLYWTSAGLAFVAVAGIAAFLAQYRISDRTRARDAARLRELNERLRSSNEELQQYAYVASHDLKEPLRMVAQYLDVIRLRFGDALPTDASRYLAGASTAAEQAQRLIEDVLQLARIDAPSQVQDLESAAVVDEVAAAFAAQLEESGGRIERGALPRVRFDRARLYQLFANLIGNAIKFRSDERTPVVRVDAVRQDGAWRFGVHDNGIGIPAEYRERVFALFQRLHGRDRYPGTGVGLAICRKIVEQQGGRIWVEARPGGGSSFFFTIPFGTSA